MNDYVAQTKDAQRKSLVMAITNDSVFMRILRFIPVAAGGNGAFTYSYAEQVTLGGVAFRKLNENYNPDIGVVNPKTESLKIMGGEVRTDRQILSTRASQIIAKNQKGRARVRQDCH